MVKRKKELILILFISAVFLNQGICPAGEGVKESIKETAKETKKTASESAKKIASEVRKTKRMVIEEIKEGWLSVKKAVKGAYSATKEEMTDTAITAKVKATFLASKKKDSFKDIEVSTKDHTVTLKGKAKSAKDAADAIETALNVDGVEKVKSELTEDDSL